jgi:hypothetical protein
VAAQNGRGPCTPKGSHVIAHIVLFRPKREAGADGIRSFATTLQSACREIRSVRRAIAGRITDDKQFIGHTTYQYVAVIEFENEEGLRSYLNSPSHKELAGLFWQFCESTIILDVNAVNLITDEIDSVLV